MYCVKPYHQDVDIGYQSSTMYRVKPYVTIGNISGGANNGQNSVSLTSINYINKKIHT